MGLVQRLQREYAGRPHLFEVRFNPGTGTSTGRTSSYDLGDLPVTDLVHDDVTGDLYASSDFGVSSSAGTTSWVTRRAGDAERRGSGSDDRPGERILFAATHGLSAWRLNLD